MSDITRLPRMVEYLHQQLRSEPFFEETSKIDHHCFRQNRSDGWIGFRSSPGCRIGFGQMEGTYFDLNLVDDVCFILSIWLREDLRGQGIGSRLYRIIEDAAQYVGCRRVILTPSGIIEKTGESRADYMTRRGYMIVDYQAIKELPEPVSV